MRRRNFYAVFRLKLPDWKRSVVVPVPLFVFDDLVSFAAFILEQVGRSEKLRRMQLRNAGRLLEAGWYAIRDSGSFTVLEVRHEEVDVSLKFY